MSIARNGRPGRPCVSVVMPFSGSRDEAWDAVEQLGRLHLLDGDERLLADNAGALAGAGGGRLEVRASTGVSVAVAGAAGERSPAHARNAGAGATDPRSEWILFLDADTVTPPALLDRYFAEPIADDVGAVAGGIAAVPVGPRAGVAARYGAHKNFLDAGAHLAHPFMPRAAAANLLVRRAAFDAVGGFFEGLRAAEDTDFSWRLQRAGWTLVGRSSAVVEHRYRDSLGALRRQWRGYAAGRAWLGRRYDGFDPQPALVRAARTSIGRVAGTAPDPAVAPPPPSRSDEWLGDNHRQVKAISQPGSVAARDRVLFPVLDVILGVEELIGFTLSNRPAAALPGERSAMTVLVVDRFPTGDAAATADPAPVPPVRIEAARRADRPDRPDRPAEPPPDRPGRPEEPPPDLTIVYREDDGLLDRSRALAALVGRTPSGVLTAAMRNKDGAPSVAALAPAACRLLADPAATLTAVPPDPVAQAAVRRLVRLAGRETQR